MKRLKSRCTYAVALEAAVSDGEIRSIAHYLSTLCLAECEVLIVDHSERFEQHRRVLRWVGRHVGGTLDVIQAAVELGTCEKVIVAAAESRYTAAEIESMCALLDRHEVVEPEEYVHPLPWWGGIDAARILVHRGADQALQRRSTFAFRRSVFRDHNVLLAYKAKNVFVRREPPRLASWLKVRRHDRSVDLFFLAFLPLLVMVAVFGGMWMATECAGLMAFAATGLAVRGRAGAGKFFPPHACLYAPLWIAERSISVYWALFERLSAVPAARLKPMSVGVTTPRETNGSATTIA
jgi:hypothetical protein